MKKSLYFTVFMAAVGRRAALFLARFFALNVILSIILTLALTAPVCANDRLNIIQANGRITLGYRDASLPFSYLDNTQKPIGYSMDICHGIVRTVEKSLGIALKVEQVPVTSSTRIPLLANGTVDLECGSTSNTLPRQKQISFAPTTFVTETHFVTKKVFNIQHLTDLQGKTVVSTAGTSNVKWLIKENQRRKLDLKIVLAKDHADAFLMVKHGRAAAFFMDEVLLAGFVANAHHPEEWVISQEAYMAQPYAIGLPKGSPKFKAVVDSAVIAMMEDGTIEKLYNQWFNAPIPPREVNLQLPMHKVLKKVLAYPTDSGDPLHYQ